MIFLSVNDYLEVGSFVTFRVSSSGAFSSANSELVIVKPNGGQTLYTDQLPYATKLLPPARATPQPDLGDHSRDH